MLGDGGPLPGRMHICGNGGKALLASTPAPNCTVLEFSRGADQTRHGENMDFIERWFHVSPDGGNGTLEAFYIFALVACVVLAVFRRRVAAAGRRLLDRLVRR